MKFRLAALSFFIALGISGCASSGIYDPEHLKYSQWLTELKTEMQNRGISGNTIKKVYTEDYYHPQPEVVKYDRRQPEFAMTSTDYLNRMINRQKVIEGQHNYQKLKSHFNRLENLYGVQPEYLIAFWGMETNYGRHFGTYPVIASLTQLSYDQRRPQFFREQLYQALKIIDDWNIDYTKMQGSWAGAMGHFQFMPSTLNAYAVDDNHDGQIDIWHSFEDASASAANYLHSVGWVKGQPWGAEVSLPWNFDFKSSGRGTQKTVAEWKKIGVQTVQNQRLPFDPRWKASIIIPEGQKGQAYMVFNNFRVIMKWNRSQNYALAVGLLADYIKNGHKWQPFKINPALRLKTNDIMRIQAFINEVFGSNLSEDGQLGEKTREEIQKIQTKANLVPDGYPDAKLLNKINKYNPQVGFSIPVPKRKLHKSR